MKKIFLILSLMLILLTACGGGNDDATPAEGENPLSSERPYAVAVLDMQTATEYPGDGDETITAKPGRKFALIKVATEAFFGFSPGDLAFTATSGSETFVEAWAHQDKLTYDTAQTNQYGNGLGNGWLVYDVPETTTAFDLVVTGPDANRAAMLDVVRWPIELP